MEKWGFLWLGRTVCEWGLRDSGVWGEGERMVMWEGGHDAKLRPRPQMYLIWGGLWRPPGGQPQLRASRDG